MHIYHIGTISFESEKSARELKSIGGITGYISDLIEYSLSKGVKIGFIGRIYNYSPRVNFKYVKVMDKITSTNKFLLNLFIKSIFIRLPKDSIIHAHRPDHFAAFRFFNSRPGVITIHGQQAVTVNSRKGFIVRTIYNTLEKYAIRKAQLIIAVDHVTKQYYDNLYPKYKSKIKIVPTGVDQKLFKPLNKVDAKVKLGLKKDDKVIVYVGRIEPPKRLDLIIHSFADIVKNDKSYRLVIVGDGVLRAEIEKLISELSIQDYVKMLGVRKRIELPEIYSAGDISILISGNEGSPLSVKESLACGVPVLANNVGDIAQVITNNYNGFVVNRIATEDISNGIIELVKISDSIYNSCLKSVESFFTEAVSNVLLEDYSKL